MPVDLQQVDRGYRPHWGCFEFGMTILGAYLGDLPEDDRIARAWLVHLEIPFHIKSTNTFFLLMEEFMPKPAKASIFMKCREDNNDCR